MILSQDLKKLVSQLPDGVEVCAYEGERSGLRLIKGGNEMGWIEIGENGVECDTTQHDIQAFHDNRRIPAPHCMQCGEEMTLQLGDNLYTTVARCKCCDVFVRQIWNKPIKIQPFKMFYASWK